MPTVLMTAPYMIPFLDRFKPVFDKYGIGSKNSNVVQFDY